MQCVIVHRHSLLRIRLTPRATLTETLCPNTTLFRSVLLTQRWQVVAVLGKRAHDQLCLVIRLRVAIDSLQSAVDDRAADAPSEAVNHAKIGLDAVRCYIVDKV